MAKQLYDYWFVQFDFPNEEGKPYKSSGGKMVWNDKLKREIPEGWEVKSINDLSTICRGVSYKPSDLQDNGVLILRGNNIENNHIVYDNNTAFLLPSMISAEQKIKRHDIIITMSSGSKEHIGKCAMFQMDSKHSFGAFLSKITPNKDCPHFIFLFLSSIYFKQKIKSICNGTGINNLTNQTFDEVRFAYPTPKTLKLFEKRIQSIFDTIGNNDAENEVLTKQREEILPLLMNGQVSVNYHLSVLEVGIRIGKILYFFQSFFYTRLAVSKWIAPRSFSMGGVLGYPTSFLVDTWQAKRYEILPLPRLYIWQAKRKRRLNGISQCVTMRLSLWFVI